MTPVCLPELPAAFDGGVGTGVLVAVGGTGVLVGVTEIAVVVALGGTGVMVGVMGIGVPVGVTGVGVLPDPPPLGMNWNILPSPAASDRFEPKGYVAFVSRSFSWPVAPVSEATLKVCGEQFRFTTTA
jgi:hypothetical protein